MKVNAAPIRSYHDMKCIGPEYTWPYPVPPEICKQCSIAPRCFSGQHYLGVLHNANIAKYDGLKPHKPDLPATPPEAKPEKLAQGTLF